MENNWKIIVNDDLSKNACSLEEWFKQHVEHFVSYVDQFGQLRELHPYLQACKVEYTNAKMGDVITLLNGDAVVKKWRDNTTLQLGKVASEIVKIIGNHEN